MPGNVGNSVVSTVMPLSLSRTFVHAREYALIENEYRNGESQREKLAETSRKSWQIGKLSTPTLAVELRNFYDARGGPTEPFYFYDPWDTSPKFTYDPTGVATTGRYTVRFEGEWSQASGIVRTECGIRVVETA